MKKYLPGVLLSTAIAIIASFLGSRTPFISASVFSLFLGMGIRFIIKDLNNFSVGIDLVSKRLLKVGIILLGTSLSVTQILQVGKFSLFVMTFTLLASFGFGYVFGKLFKMNWKLSTLISAGTGICGGSAIAALSPVIEANDSDIAYSISATFIFDVIMIVLFPIMGRALGLSDMAYGLWTGTAVNDTSAVVAAGYAFSNAAGDFATIVKLTRTLSIIPVIIIFSIINQNLKNKTLVTGTTKTSLWSHLKMIDFKKVFPWFIIFFLIAAILNTVGIIPSETSHMLTKMSKFFMVMALGAIGLKTNFTKLKQSGILPMVHGCIISTIVVVVSLVVQIFLGQV